MSSKWNHISKLLFQKVNGVFEHQTLEYFFKSNMFVTNMPSYTGPYKVACRDIEYVKPTSQNVNEPKNGSLQPSSLLVKVFYPAEIDVSSRNLARWASFPSMSYFRGLMDYKELSRLVSTPLAFLFGNQPKLGAFQGDGSELIKTKKPLPVAIFSHGLAGCRTGYSGICGEMASYGVVVCAIEHRDGTAVYSYASTPPHSIEYQHPPGKTGDPEHRKFYEDRIKFRVQEVHRAFGLMKSLNQGTVESTHLAPANQKCPDYKELPDKSKWEDGLKEFQGRLEISQPLAVGHSFGGATILEVLSRKSNVFKAGVIFDPWMYPIAGCPVHRPVLVVNSQAFSNWGANFERVKKLLKDSNALVKASPPSPIFPAASTMFISLPHTEHIHQSDIPTVFRWISSKIFKSSIDPIQALQRNAFAALSFINHQLNPNLIYPPLGPEVDILDIKSPDHPAFVIHEI